MYFCDCTNVSELNKEMLKINKLYAKKFSELTTKKVSKKNVKTNSTCGARMKNTNDICCRPSQSKYGNRCGYHKNVPFPLNPPEVETSDTELITETETETESENEIDIDQTYVRDDAPIDPSCSGKRMEGLLEFIDETKTEIDDLGQTLYNIMIPVNYISSTYEKCDYSSAKWVKMYNEYDRRGKFGYSLVILKDGEKIDLTKRYMVKYNKYRFFEYDNYENNLPLDGIIFNECLDAYD